MPRIIDIGKSTPETSIAALATIPKEEHSLSLYHWGRDQDIIAADLAQIVRHVPEHVTALSFVHIARVNEESLGLFYEAIPSHVTKVILNYSWDKIRLSNAFSKLPQTITDLNISYLITFYDGGELALLLASLPKKLKKLSFGQLTNCRLTPQKLTFAFSHLPKTLEILDFHFTHVHNVNDLLAFFKALPGSITRLNLDWCYLYKNPTILADLPIHIAHLDLSSHCWYLASINSFRLDVNSYKRHVHPTLNPVRFSHLFKFINIFKHIPAHVKELTIHADAVTTLPDELLILIGQSLPHLVKLNIVDAQFRNEGGVNEKKTPSRVINLLKNNIGNWFKEEREALIEPLPQVLIEAVLAYNNNATPAELSALFNVKDRVERRQDERAKFLARYNEVFREDCNNCFGFFRVSNLNQSWSLMEIIEHGMKENNRTRKICMELGWLSAQGKLLKPVPQYIWDEFEHDGNEHKLY